MKISVVICTYNPRLDYIQRTLKGVAQQTLSSDDWELIIIDNKSTVPLEGQLQLRQFSNARIVCETTQGLTPARIRGYKESTGDLLVYVDDDNVLKPDYLEWAISLMEQFPFLGAIGGSTIGDYELPPAKHLEKYMNYIGVRRILAAHWSNSTDDGDHCPIGAGMVIRQNVVEAWVERAKQDANRYAMDRSGNLLTGSGDTDMAYTAIDLGMGVGVFPELELLHLIPAGRVAESYLLRLAGGTSYSANMLRYIRGKEMWQAPTRRTLLQTLSDWINLCRPTRRFDCCFRRAQSIGIRKALSDVASLEHSK